MYLDGHIINISNDSLRFKILRLENNLPSSTWSSSLCIGELCAPPFVDSVATDSLIPPGDSVYFDLIIFQTDTIPDVCNLLLRFATLHDLQTIEQRFYASTILSNINNDNPFISNSFKLFGNYPNPFNNQTIISAYVDKVPDVTLQIFDILGREIYTAQRKAAATGKVTFKWSGTNNFNEELSSGIYFYKISAISNTNVHHSQIKKMTLLR